MSVGIHQQNLQKLRHAKQTIIRAAASTTAREEWLLLTPTSSVPSGHNIPYNSKNDEQKDCPR